MPFAERESERIRGVELEEQRRAEGIPAEIFISSLRRASMGAAGSQIADRTADPGNSRLVQICADCPACGAEMFHLNNISLFLRMPIL